MPTQSTAALLLFSVLLAAADFMPRQSRIHAPDPIASPEARVGGSITEYLGPSPKSLNYYLDNNMMSAQVFGMLYESLLDMDSQTLEYDRGLAEKWTVSEDKMTFTFWLDPAARWSDGRPVSVDDVIWTYQAIVDPANLTGPHKITLERLFPPEAVDDGRAIRFRARELHWQNLGAAGGFAILPRHCFAGQDFNRINVDFPVVSGPYAIREFKEGQHLQLVRRDDWWRRQWPALRGVFNFASIRYRFFEDRENAFEAFKKGEIDVFPVYTASQWYQIEDRLAAVRHNWIVKQAIYNHKPVGFQGFAMNMRRPPFDDVRVRQAMAHLIDRATMNSTMMYGQYFLHRSYWEDLYAEPESCPNQPVAYDPEAARRLLAEAGWRANARTGILEKDGRELAFTFLSRDTSTDKFLVPFNEALKKAGVRMTIQSKDWSAWAKDMDAYNFDMTWAAWGAGLFKDPESLWHSREADRPGGNNITGFKDAGVDARIERLKGIFSVAERHALVRDIDALIFARHPYALLWNLNYTRLLYWNKFGTPPTILGKYSGESTSYWWYDEEAASELQEAIANQEPLPKQPERIDYDQVRAQQGEKP